jgi:hypothetical protein
MFFKKSIHIIALLICISATTGVKSERPVLWISLMSAGYVGSMVAGGLLGAYFPSPALGVNGGNFTWVVGMLAASGAYTCISVAAAFAPQSFYDCVRRKCSN